MSTVRLMTLSHSIAALMLLLPLTLPAASNDPSISYQYDAMGNLTQRTDGLGHVTTQRFDALNRLINQLQPSLDGTDTPGEIQYQYDTQGNTAQITDPKGFATYNTIDGLGNLSQLDSPDTGAGTYSHDQAGNLVSKTDAGGIAASYRYDVANRLTQIQHAKLGSVTESVSLQYDQGTNGLGRLSNMRNNSGLINTWNYDLQGRIIGQQQTTGQLNLKLQIQYDNAGRPQTLVYPSGRVVGYSYDAAGRISRIDIDGVPAITGITWQPFGGVQSWTWAGSGNTYARSYDLAGRVASVTLGDDTRNLEWDAANRIVQSVDNKIALPATAANLQTYNYDNLDHLTQYLNTNTQQDYSYDLDGNRTRRTTDGNAVDYDYATNNNQLMATSTKHYSYDAVGRIINDGVNQYSYNNSGQLTQVVNSQSRTWYYYNGLGQRVGKWLSNPQDFAGDATHDGRIDLGDYRKIAAMLYGSIPLDPADDCNRDNTISSADVLCVRVKYVSVDPYQLAFTHFVYDPAGHLIGEYRQIGAPIRETVYLGDTPVLILMPGTTAPTIHTIDTDHLNTPRVIKNNAGTIVWRWDQSEPFGITQPNSNPSGLGTFTYNLRFPGQYYDQETGLHYNMARYYHPGLGRYLQSDPIGLAGGINTYTYVYNNPLRYVDPLGLDVTININRTTYTPTSIVGTIDVSSTVTNQTFSGNTLENATPPNQNLPVPPGTYSAFVRTDYTPNRIQLNNVPQASGVQIHKGNTSSDVVGCFAAGTSTSPNFVGGSGNAMNQINNIISADGTGNITVIVNGATSAPTPGQ